MAAHTPGPWQLRASERDWTIIGPAPRADDYPRVWMVAATISHEPEDEANARLMTAAPDLLADAMRNDSAFTWLAEQMNSITDNAKYWTVAQIERLAQDLRIGIERNQKRTRAAIANAEGR